MKRSVCLLAFFCTLYGLAQRPLQVGDTLPANILALISASQYPAPAIQNQGSPLKNTSSDRHIIQSAHQQTGTSSNQLIILDFWATWCTACIKGLGKLQTLQKTFPELKVLLVNAASTGDTKQKIEAFAKKRFGGKLPFPSLEQDTVFKQYFPYTLLPHYVWLHKGKVAAVTGADELTETNMRSILANTGSPIIQKKDMDAGRPLFTSADLPAESLQQYAILVKGKYPGLGSGNRLRRSGSRVHGHAVTNMPLLYIYRMVALSLVPGFSDKTFHLQIADSALEQSLRQDNKMGEGPLYTVDYIVPPTEADSLYPKMLSFLNNATGWQGRVVEREMPVGILKKWSPASPVLDQSAPVYQLNDKSNPCISNAKPSALIAWLNQQPWLQVPVIADTALPPKITLSLPAGINSLAALNEALCPLGFELVLRVQPLTLFHLAVPAAEKHGL